MANELPGEPQPDLQLRELQESLAPNPGHPDYEHPDPDGANSAGEESEEPDYPSIPDQRAHHCTIHTTREPHPGVRGWHRSLNFWYILENRKKKGQNPKPGSEAWKRLRQKAPDFWRLQPVTRYFWCFEEDTGEISEEEGGPREVA